MDLNLKKLALFTGQENGHPVVASVENFFLGVYVKSNYQTWTLVRVGINLLALTLLGFTWYHVKHQKAPSFANSPADLRVLAGAYNFYNKEYFKGELPIPMFGWTGDDKYRALTVHKNDKWMITFNPKYNRSENDAALHLLHEMCHVKTLPKLEDKDNYHGQEFEDCMHGLASKGAFDDIW